METAAVSLPMVAARGRPVALADTRLVEVPGALADLFPEGGIRRGSTVVIDPASGGMSLALVLAAEVTGGGAWAAAVGLPSLGLAAAAELGVRLNRLALVPDAGEQWAVVAAALLDGVDLLLLGAPGRPRAADARRLAARVRERGTVLMVIDPEGSWVGQRGGQWPETPDVRLTVARSAWAGLGAGYGHLQARKVEVVLTGRRAAVRARHRFFWLPDPEGKVLALSENDEWCRASEWEGSRLASLPNEAAELVG
jgi:hypothetical protein